MKWAALGTWIVTIDGGLLLLGFWLRAGGARRARRRGPRIGPELVSVHFSLAASALGLWIVYLSRGGTHIAVATLCVLAATATLGLTMFSIWLVHRLVLGEGRAGKPEPRPPGERLPGERLPDQRLPVVIVALHGVFAVTTLSLVAVVVAQAV